MEHCAVGRREGFIELHRGEWAELSTTLEHLSLRGDQVSGVKIPMFTLETLLKKRAIQKIDLLSIDTEGTEIDVLESMDLYQHSPEVIIVEFNTAGWESGERELRKYFDRLPYVVIHKTLCNLIYKRHSTTDLVAR